MSTQAYRALVKEARRMGLPVAFKADLYTHDRRQLELSPRDQKFGWMLRACGTFLFFPLQPGQDPYTKRYLERIASIFPDTHLYYWDGQELRGIGPDELARLLNGEPDEN
jgi:hypothetical protein